MVTIKELEERVTKLEKEFQEIKNLEYKLSRVENKMWLLDTFGKG